MGNAICDLFGIRYPIIMGAISQTPELAAAISNAGGLGCIAGAIAPPDQLRERIRKLKDMTDKPFALNFPIALTPQKDIQAKMDMMGEENVPVVITSAGSPRVYTKMLQERGSKVAHVLPTLMHARKAVEAGVDCIIAEPAESGGYRGEHEVSMMVLIRVIRRAFPEIPIAAAGAVADGPGFAAVIALGADGVQLGTRFLATVEANAPEPVQKLILAATDTSTMSAEGRIKPRINRPELAEEVLGERKQTQMGQVSAIIDSIDPVEKVIREIVEGGVKASRRLQQNLEAMTGAAV